MKKKSVNFDYVFMDLDGILQNNHSENFDPVHMKIRRILKHVSKEKLGVITNNPVAWNQLKTYGFENCVNSDLVFQSYQSARKLADELASKNDYVFLNHLDDVSKKVYMNDPGTYASLLEDVVTKKPGPYMFDEAIKTTGASPENCLIIGDSYEDILGGSLAGWKTLYLKGLEDDRYLTVDKLGIEADYVVNREDVCNLESILFKPKAELELKTV